MPIYDYACQECGRVFEVIRSASEDTEPPCPACASVRTERRVSAPARCGGLADAPGPAGLGGGCGSGGFS